MNASLRGILASFVLFPLTALFLGENQGGGKSEAQAAHGQTDHSSRDQTGHGPGEPQGRKTPKLARAGKYVRDVETCADCHEEEHEAIQGSVHAGVPRSAFLENCETCHGPGAAHSEDNEAEQITQPHLLPLVEQRRLCARCHREQIQEHGGPLPELEKQGKTCSDCHSVHRLRTEDPGYGDARRFDSKRALDVVAQAVGAKRCVHCHGDKQESLRGRSHRELLGTRAEDPDWHAEMSCEACHGKGSLHAKDGIGRWITRPDRALDGDASCRACHAEVDPDFFHWKNDEHPPLLGLALRAKRGAERPGEARSGLRCTSCHRVHEDGDPENIPRSLRRARPFPRADQASSRPTRARARASQEPGATLADARLASRQRDRALLNTACLNCHREAYGILHGTTHAELARLDLPPGKGCVSCHPGAADHVRFGGAKSLISSLHGAPAPFIAQTCNACHGGRRAVCGYSLGAHGKSQISCLSCHSPAARSSEIGKLRDANKNCAQCHPGVSLSFRHANRHPLGEGLFSCSSCHEAHDPIKLGPSSARRMSRKCANCHKQFRGPFVFPHHADKGQGCLACHSPHGSPNRKLLDKPRARENCLSCHADLPSFHDLTPGSRFQNCLQCHVKVHGSNRNRFYFR